MLIRSKLLMASALAALALDVGATTSAANRLSVSTRLFRITWRLAEVLGEPFPEPIQCNITVEGSFHSSTMTKSEGLLIGHVSRASVAPCQHGNLTINQEALPWHVRYRGFTGALPSIAGVILGFIGFKYTLHDEATGLTCVTSSTALHPFIATMDVSLGVIEQLRIVETAPIPLSGQFFCEVSGNSVFSGSGLVRLLGSTTTKIRLTLI